MSLRPSVRSYYLYNKSALEGLRVFKRVQEGSIGLIIGKILNCTRCTKFKDRQKPDKTHRLHYGINTLCNELVLYVLSNYLSGIQ